jgi:hypothetical protein
LRFFSRWATQQLTLWCGTVTAACQEKNAGTMGKMEEIMKSCFSRFLERNAVEISAQKFSRRKDIKR